MCDFCYRKKWQMHDDANVDTKMDQKLVDVFLKTQEYNNRVIFFPVICMYKLIVSL